MTSFLRKLSYVSVVALLTGCGGSSSKDADVDVTNLAPLAQIDVLKTEIDENEEVTFSAEKSTDPNGDVITYKWRVVNASGETVPLENDSAKNLTLSLEDFGTYTVELQVKDATLTSEKVSKTLTVKPSMDDFPYVKISGDTVAKTGAVNWFNSEGSSGGNGQDLTYQWSIKSKPENSNAVMVENDQVRSYFIADIAGDYEVLLIVTNANDKLQQENVLAVKIDDLLTNSAPIADITLETRNFAVGELVKLDASSSHDVDGDVLTYVWSMSQRPEGSQSELVINEELAEFVPDKEGIYSVKLIAKDESLQGEASTGIDVTLGNIRPVADAGEDRLVAINTFIELDGSASSDSEGQSLQYEWSLVNKPENSNYSALDEPKLDHYSKFVFEPDVTGKYTFNLYVYDGEDYSASDQVTIEVVENARPVAMLPEDKVVYYGDLVHVSGSNSYDPEDQLLTYKWELISSPDGFDGELQKMSQGDHSLSVYLIPTVVGSYTIQLIVNDGTNDSIPETMTIVREEEVIYSREVSGKLVDAQGNGVSGMIIGGILMTKSVSDENGEFNVTLVSQKIDVSLRLLSFRDGADIHGYMSIPEYEEASTELGDVTMPVMQRKDISLVACEGYTGPETITINFLQTSKGYENIQFRRYVKQSFTVDEDAKQVMLPASAELEMRLSNLSLSIEAPNGEHKFDNQYQVDDSQDDPLLLTVCK